MEYAQNSCGELVADLDKGQIEGLLDLDEKEIDLLMKEENEITWKDNLYFQEYTNDLKTIFKAQPRVHLGNALNATAALSLCSLNLLAYKLFQADMSYMYMSVLSSTSIMGLA